MERKLVTIEKIQELRPIEGADAIECAIVRSWPVVVKKNEYQVGHWCLYCEIDSFLPVREEFEFLRKSSFKRLPDGTEGFRLKTVKLRGQVSQGLVLPLKTLNDVYLEPEMVIGWNTAEGCMTLGPYENALRIEEGVDVTELLGVTKYEPPLAACLAGVARGNFPSFIPKTDEDRIQNKKKILYTHEGVAFYGTEKLEGSSSTFYLNENVFGVCSRNLDLEEIGENSFWKTAREMELEERMREFSDLVGGLNFALQGELIGEGIQGNIYQLKGTTVRFFNAYNIDTKEYFSKDAFDDMMKHMCLEAVPLIYENMLLPETVDEIVAMADGPSALNPKTKREGLVFRTYDADRVSFKAISNAYLLSEK